MRARKGSTFGAKVQHLLSERKDHRQRPYNPKQLAEEIGIDSGTVYGWINEGARPRSDIGRKVALALGVDFHALTDDSRDMDAVSIPATLDDFLKIVPADQQPDIMEILRDPDERAAIVAWWRRRHGRE